MNVRYYLLKMMSLLMTTAGSFGLVFTLLRVVSVKDYSMVALATASAGYVLAMDLGFSSIVYAKTRKAYLTQSPDGANRAVIAFLIYAAVAGVSVLLFALASIAPFWAPIAFRSALFVYFISLVCALPWTIVRMSAAAIDKFLLFEKVELARRTASLLLVGALFKGLGLLGFAMLTLVLWAICYGVMVASLRPLFGGSIDFRQGLRTLRHDLRLMRHAALFSALESATYSFPYLLIAAVYRNALAIVAFDAFYKVVRFAATSFSASSDPVLPGQTAAIHRGDFAALLRGCIWPFVLAAAPMLAGIVLVGPLGDQTFRILLKDATRAPETVRLAMIIMLIAGYVQNPSGSLLLFTGKVVTLSRVAMGVAMAMAVLSLVVIVTGQPFQTFILGYSLVYAAGACVYGTLLIIKVWRFGQLPAGMRAANW